MSWVVAVMLIVRVAAAVGDEHPYAMIVGLCGCSRRMKLVIASVNSMASLGELGSNSSFQQSMFRWLSGTAGVIFP